MAPKAIGAKCNINLILFVLFCGCFVSVLHGEYATSNFYEFQQVDSENRTVNISMRMCDSVEVNRAVSVVIGAAAKMSSHAFCAMADDGHTPAATLQQLHIQFRQILRLALDLSTELDPETYVDVVALFGSLENVTEATMQNLQFVEFWVYLKFLPVVPYLIEENLTQLSQKNFTCEAFQMIVRVFGREEMLITDEQLEMIFTNLIYTYLSREDTTDPGCFSNITNDNEWLQMNLGIFFKYANLRHLQMLNSYFTEFNSFVVLSPSQVAELVQNSGALKNMSMINMIFGHLDEGDAFQNVDEFFQTLTKTETLEIDPVVRDFMMNRTFDIISLHFPYFTKEDWVSWFNVKLLPLLPSLTAEMLLTAISNTDCSEYHIIIEGLSSASDQLTLLRRREVALVLVGYLNQIHRSTLSCGSDSSSLSSWLTENFGKFSVYVDFEDLRVLNANISSVEALDLLSPSQIVQLTVISGALNNTNMINMVFDRLESDNAFQNVDEFLAGLAQISQGLEIHPVVRNLMMNRTFAIIRFHFPHFLRADWVSWFNVKLIPLLPSLTAEMLQTTTSNINCIGYHVIIEGLSSVFDHLTLLRQQEITLVLVDFLRQSHNLTSSCGSDTSSLSSWLAVNFGKFSIYVDFEDLLVLNANFSSVEALEFLSSSQIVQMTVNSGALNNTDMINMVFDHLEGNNAFQNVNDFLEGLAHVSQGLVIHSVVRDLMMNRTFGIISLHFSNFSRVDWVSWFSVKLIPLLPSLTAEMLHVAMSDIDCSGYHAIVEGLSSVFEHLTLLRRQQVTLVFLGFLRQIHRSGSSCGSETSSLSSWLAVNFGKFSVYVDFEDLLVLNANFSSVEALDLLSSSQIVQLTVNSGALNNTDMINIVFDHLEGGNGFQNLNEFLEGLANTLQGLEIHPVVRDLMMNRTFGIISLHFPHFLTVDWVSWFKAKLIPLLPSLTAEMLYTATSNTDCIGYHIIVESLNSVFDHLTLLRRQEFTRVLVGFLKQSYRAASSCGSDTSSLSSWLAVNFGKFSIYVDFEDLFVLNANFSSVEALDLLSSYQISQLIVNSGALNNTDMINMVFDRLEIGDAFQNIDDFLAGLAQTSQGLEIYPVVRDLMMNRTFGIISFHFSHFLRVDWVSWFNVKLIPLLPSLTAEMLHTVTSNIDCIGYHVIVEGLNSVFDQLTLLRRQEISFVLVGYLKQIHRLDLSCGSDTSSLSSWLTVNFGKFSIYVDFKDLRLLNSEFSSVEALDVLSSSQIAQMTVNSGALNNTDIINMVFDQLENGDAFQNINDYLAGLAQMSQSLEIHPVVRDLMMNRTFGIISLHFSHFLTVDWISWFNVKLIPLLPSLTAEMLHITTSNIDCIQYHIIVEGLSSVFDHLTLLRRQEISLVLVGYLKQIHRSALACGSDTSSPSSWLAVNFGKFSIYVDFEDLLVLNANFSSIQSLDLLSSSQIAQLTVNSGALTNTDMINMVFNHLDGSNAFQSLDDFLEGLAQTSQSVEIHPVVRDLMMNRTFGIISFHFPHFLIADWVSWFNVKLIPLLPSMTAEMLQSATSNIDCIGYHVIIVGLNSVFDQLTLLRRQEFTFVLVDFLKQSQRSTMSCGSDTSSLSSWLTVNFGKFSIYVNFEDLLVLNANFSSFEALDLLSSSQIAQLTLNSEALNNTNMINLIFDHLEDGSAFQNVDDFLTSLAQTSHNLKIHPLVRDLMMNRTFGIISHHFPYFLSADWVSWFTVKLIPLLPSLTAEMLHTTTLHIDCNGYHTIVDGLSSIFEQLTLLRRQEIPLVLVGYLKQFHRLASSCGSDTNSLSSWLALNFGKFSVYVDYEDLRLLNSNFASVEALDLLSSSQIAQMTVYLGALNNTDIINMVFDHLEYGDAFKNVDDFLAGLAQTSQSLEIHPVARNLMMNRTFVIISLQFPQFSRVDWVSWFNVKLIPLLPSLTAEMLHITTSNTDCIGYHIIVEGLSSVFEQFTLLRRQEISRVLVGYLKQIQRLPLPCGSDTSSLSSWLALNFGKFSVYVDYEDLRLLNSDFASVEALDVLSSSQIAQLTVSSGALSNTDMINMVFDHIEGGDAFQNLDDFLEGLAETSQDLEIHSVVRDLMMNRTFGIISLHFSHFLTVDWVSWFNVKLIPLLPSMTAEMLHTATSNIDCSGYHIIVSGLSSVFDHLTLLRRQEVTLVLLGFLRQSHGSASSCGSDNSSLSSWLAVNFGKFSVYVDFEDLLVLNANFSSFEALDLLSSSQIAQLVVNSGALNNTDMINMVFDHLETGDAFQNLNGFLEGLAQTSQGLEIHPVVRDLMMNQTFDIINLHFPRFLRVDWDSWFNLKLIPLLPSLTAEMLQTTTSNVDCIGYHVIVEGLSRVFDHMTVLRQQEITLVLVGYLKQSYVSALPCGSDTNSVVAWLDVNFGKFSLYVNFEDLQELEVQGTVCQKMIYCQFCQLCYRPSSYQHITTSSSTFG